MTIYTFITSFIRLLCSLGVSIIFIWDSIIIFEGEASLISRRQQYKNYLLVFRGQELCIYNLFMLVFSGETILLTRLENDFSYCLKYLAMLLLSSCKVEYSKWLKNPECERFREVELYLGCRMTFIAYGKILPKDKFQVSTPLSDHISFIF